MQARSCLPPLRFLCPFEFSWSFIFSAPVFGFGVQKQSAGLCSGQIKVQKLKAFVVRFLWGSTTTPSIRFHSLPWYLLCALSDSESQIRCANCCDLALGGALPGFSRHLVLFYCIHSHCSPDNILALTGRSVKRLPEFLFQHLVMFTDASALVKDQTQLFKISLVVLDWYFVVLDNLCLNRGVRFQDHWCCRNKQLLLTQKCMNL